MNYYIWNHIIPIEKVYTVLITYSINVFTSVQECIISYTSHIIFVHCNDILHCTPCFIIAWIIFNCTLRSGTLIDVYKRQGLIREDDDDDD